MLTSNSNTLPALVTAVPAEIRTRCGGILRTDEPRWSFHGGHKTYSMPFESLLPITTSRLLESLKLTLCWYAENHSVGYAAGLHRCLLGLVSHIAANKVGPVDEITAADLINFKASLSRAQEPRLGSARTALVQWHALGYPGVADDAIKLLHSLRIRGAEKGVAVATRDPYIGPYSDFEYEAIIDSLNDGYGRGLLSREQYLLVWFFILFGARPAQFALMKVCDIVEGKAQDGSALHLVSIPAVKTRTARRRDVFLKRFLKAPLAPILEEHVRAVKSHYCGRLSDVAQAPMFPAKRVEMKQSAGLEFHSTSPSINARLARALDSLKIRSERTGDFIHVSSIRFRRTLGTRLAAEGHGELVIAEALGHSDTQNVRVYTQSTSEISARIDRAIAFEMVPIAQAFKGVIVESECHAVRGEDPDSRIVDGRFDESLKPMGSCGTYAFCGLAAPLACYTCKSFQPWLDAPHEKVLDFLIDERNRLLDTTDLRIAKINDRTIAAVAEVVQRCAQMK